jgi:hypothetical protein
MTATDATTAPRRTGPRRRYSEQLHTLVDLQTRAYILGLASLAADAGGYATPREAEETRDLLDVAIAARYQEDPQAYARAVERGRATMAERAWEASFRKAKAAGLGDIAAKRRADREVPEHKPRRGADYVEAAGGVAQA